HTRFSRDWSSDVCSSDLNIDRCLYAPAFKYLASGDGLFAVIGGQAQKAKTHLGFVMSRNERTLALAAQKQIFGCKFVNCLTHRALADLESGGKLQLAGYGFAGFPLATVKTLQQQTLDLLIQRAIRRAGGSALGIGRRVCDGFFGHERRRRCVSDEVR